MGWQAPNYIYPVPEQLDVAGSLVKGGVVGATMGMKISDRVQEKALQNDIAAAWKSGEAKVADIDAKHAEAIAAAPHEQSFVKQPDQAQPEGIKAAMGGNPELVANTELAPRSLSIDPGKNQITGNKALMMAGVTPVETPGVLSPSEKATETQIMADVATKNPAELDKITQEYKTKRIEAKAGTWNDLHGVYMKHGKVKEALEIQDKYFDQVVKVGALDYKTGTKLWNNSFLKDKYGEIDLTPKPKFKVVGDHGSYIKVNETTGEVAPIQSVGELKSQDPTHNVYMKVTDKDGNIVWNQVQFGKPKEPTGDNLRKFKNEKGEEVTEELVTVDGVKKWLPKAKSPAKAEKEDKIPKDIDMKPFHENLAARYAGLFKTRAEEGGKALKWEDMRGLVPEDEDATKTPLGERKTGSAKVLIKDIVRTGEDAYRTARNNGKTDVEAIREADIAMNAHAAGGSAGTNVPPVNISIKNVPDQHKTTVSNIVAKEMAAGAKDAGFDPKTSELQIVNKDGTRKIIKIGGKAQVSGKPTPSVVNTAEAGNVNPDHPEWGSGGIRKDGTAKGDGFLGVLPITFPDKKTGVATEYSVGVSINGKNVDIPTLVPTLSKDQISLMTTDIIPNHKKVPQDIMKLAVDHAKQRISEGKSPYAGKGEQSKTAVEEAKEMPSEGMENLKAAGNVAGKVFGAIGKGATWLSNNTAGKVIDSMNEREVEQTAAATKEINLAKMQGNFNAKVINDIKKRYPYAKL